MAYDWLNVNKKPPKSFYKPAPKTVKRPPIVKPGDRRPNQYTDTGGENIPTFYNPAPASAKKVLAQPVAQTPPPVPDPPSDMPGYLKPLYTIGGHVANFYEMIDDWREERRAEKDNNVFADWPAKKSPDARKDPYYQRIDLTTDGPAEYRKPRKNQPASFDTGTIKAWSEMQNKPLSEMTSDELYMYANMYDDPVRGLEGINTKYQEWYGQLNLPALDSPDNKADIPYSNYYYGSPPNEAGLARQRYFETPLTKPVDFLNINTAFGQRALDDRTSLLSGQETTKSDYWTKPLKSKLNEIQQIMDVQPINDAINRAAPLFTPMLDENGEVLAPALMTPDEYIKGLEEQTIFDPLLPDSKFRFGKTQLVYQDGKIMPAEEWYRTVGDHLIGGNWELPEFTDQGGYQYNSRQNWANPSMAIGLENKSLQNAMNDAKITGNQFINPNFYPHINYQLYDEVVSGNEMIDDSYGEGDGGYGYGEGGYGYGYGYGSSGGYGPNYYNDAYRQNKGQYYSQLARWVI